MTDHTPMQLEKERLLIEEAISGSTAETLLKMSLYFLVPESDSGIP